MTLPLNFNYTRFATKGDLDMNGSDAREEGCEEVRCLCGNLLARLVPGGVELKCRRCKRSITLPLQSGGEDLP
ncbi:hypothetical protein [Vulgatibacter incomptus]|uniref:Uncharacterized protein n=1 Tax=Vulgatibacter incomptus TaxID=1391653 RepID=A0A0K1PCW4_9BACT|nr:hypothetical protein [Vulgatibacter incomptus]AKU90964.1 hypothetical protein AKJ08_1351 [Vulgatibacter incomptus]